MVKVIAVLPLPAGASLWNSLLLHLRKLDISLSHFKNLIEDVFVLGDGDRGALRLILKSAVYKYAYLLTVVSTELRRHSSAAK